jgi:hypothetical protein
MEWLNVRGYEFTPAEADDANSFFEVLRNFGDVPDVSGVFKEGVGRLSAGKRLVLFEGLPLGDAMEMIQWENDPRIRGVVNKRMEAENGPAC